MNRRGYTTEQNEFIKNNYKGLTNLELTTLVNDRFNLNLSVQQIKSYKGNHHFNSGLTGHFPKGHIPQNKGKKRGSFGRMSETQFKKGPRPELRTPLGTIKERADGYIWKKVNNDLPYPKRWKQVHRIKWEKAHGPIPKGKKLIFLDGNHKNTNLENLALVSLRENLEMNRKGLNYEDSELTKVGINISKINIAAAKRKKGD
ncbi:HNH endonuclease signature motif containing protein [Liquorilactobacillus satsumensis]|uniref:HNH endonuclease signature motif containing protein n=1 Tax=Liquorilactobacillus satsumensis TaxID=259059 RepID=UPI0039E8F4A4